MREVMYDQSSLFIVGVLFLLMIVFVKVGHRIGRAGHASATGDYRAHVNAVQASLLGVLALLIAFTFSLALQRFDSRSEALVEEVNAIGTAYLRSQLLPASLRGDVQSLLRRYVDLRVQSGSISLDHEEERQAVLARTNEVVEALWTYARRTAEEDGGPVTSGLFIQSLNEAFDSFGRRDAALARHVPEVVLFLLFGTFLMTGGVMGYSAGVAGHRLSLTTYILILLIVILTFIVIDLDRPRRGLIRVDQTSLIELKKAVESGEAGAAQLPVPKATSVPESVSQP